MTRPLPLWTLLLGIAGFCIGAAAMAVAAPHASLRTIGLSASAGSLLTLFVWTAKGLAPQRKGESPWPLIGKAFLWGPVAGVVAAGACITVDHEAPIAFIATGAVAGFVLGPWISAISWADTLGVFRRRNKV